MGNKKTYNAFSLVEMMIVLLLSSLVVSLAYAGLTYFSKQTQQYRNKQELISTHQQFMTQFHSDWWKADQILVSNNTLNLASEDRNISYSFGSTIGRSFNGIHSSFDISASITDKQINELNLVDFISISITYGEDELVLNEHKSYLPSLFLNQ